MGMNVQLVQHNEYLAILVSGTYTTDEAVARFANVLAACELTGLGKVLIDFRQMAGALAATEKIIYGFQISDQYREYSARTNQVIKLAYLGSPPAVSTYEPGLEVAVQSALPVALFTDESKAYEWLGVQPT
jgi:hypothetical protein